MGAICDAKEVSASASTVTSSETEARFRDSKSRLRYSIARKGPASVPLRLLTPVVPATTRNRKLCVTANASPAPAIRIAPMMGIRRRPIRSASGSDAPGNRRVPKQSQGYQEAGLGFAQSEGRKVESNTTESDP